MTIAKLVTGVGEGYRGQIPAEGDRRAAQGARDRDLQRAGEALSMPFAGVHIVEATKQVYRALPAHRERVRLIPSLQPVLMPSPSTRG